MSSVAPAAAYMRLARAATLLRRFVMLQLLLPAHAAAAVECLGDAAALERCDFELVSAKDYAAQPRPWEAWAGPVLVTGVGSGGAPGWAAVRAALAGLAANASEHEVRGPAGICLARQNPLLRNHVSCAPSNQTDSLAGGDGRARGGHRALRRQWRRAGPAGRLRR